MDWADCFDRAEGVAHRRALRAGGLSYGRITRALGSGHWQSPLPGVVVDHGGPLSQRQRWRSALAYAGPDAVLSHCSAGVLHGLRIAEPGVHVTVPHGRNLRPAGFAVVHQASRLDRDWLAGLPTTPAARTVVDIAVATRSRDDVRALVSDAVQRRIVTVTDVVTATAGAPRHGCLLLRDTLEAVVAGARSAGEALFRDLLRRAGLPEPAWNAAVDTASGRFRVDALWRLAGLAVEIDGARWHLDAASWERDLARANALQATGLRLLRFSVRQLTQDPQAVIDAVRRPSRTAQRHDHESPVRGFRAIQTHDQAKTK